MAHLNKVMFIGNLTRDPVSKGLPSGMIVCEFGLATNRRYKSSSGEDREETCFVDVDAFGKLADICSRYLRKGSLVYLEGRLRLDTWQDKTSGQNRSRHKVVADSVEFLDRKPDNFNNPQSYSYDNSGAAMQRPPQAPQGGFVAPPQQQQGGFTAPPPPQQGGFTAPPPPQQQQTPFNAPQAPFSNTPPAFNQQEEDDSQIDDPF